MSEPLDNAFPPLDADGHLVDASDWTPEIGDRMAQFDGVELQKQHWWLIGFVRDYHLRYGNPPLMRTIVEAFREAEDANASSRDLYRLFAEGPVRLACKYGGLPKPDWCI